MKDDEEWGLKRRRKEAPRSRCGHCLVCVDETNVLFLFGGADEDTIMDDGFFYQIGEFLLEEF